MEAASKPQLSVSERTLKLISLAQQLHDIESILIDINDEEWKIVITEGFADAHRLLKEQILTSIGENLKESLCKTI